MRKLWTVNQARVVPGLENVMFGQWVN